MLRRAPVALVPLSAEALVVAALIVGGALPASGASVAAAAVFPLDIFFDLKQVLAFAASWSWVAAAVALSVLVRAGALAATLWLSDGGEGAFALAWGRAARIAGVAAVVLFPAAGMFFVGVATRYAPFVWIGALLGVVPSALLVRRAVHLDTGQGEPAAAGVPEFATFLAYAYVVTAFAAAMSVLGDINAWGAALLVLALGPLHAVFLLGWREHARAGTYPGGGAPALSVTVVAVVLLLGASLYDRYGRDLLPPEVATGRGSLLLLGGVDSTPSVGALSQLDPADLGYRRNATATLSYLGAGRKHRAIDTRGDLDLVARRVGEQVAASPRPRNLLGHSQAALIVDRMLRDDVPVPARAVVLAPAPPLPPPVDIPPPDVHAPGKPGGDFARAFAAFLDMAGIRPFDVDAPASPTNLDPVVVRRPGIARLAVWALGDSVFLDGDWRRHGEINLVALTDHVGVANNERAFTAARAFFARRPVAGDESSWRGLLPALLRYAFEPWRPA